MRALLKPFVIHAAYQPIETIVFFSIVGTLAYFHVISAIKHSAFWGLSSTGSLYASYSPAAFASSPSVPPNLKPAYALLRGEDWVAVRESFWNHTTAKEDKDILSIELYTVEYESKKAYISSILLTDWPNVVVQDLLFLSNPELTETVLDFGKQLPASEELACFRPVTSNLDSGAAPCFTSSLVRTRSISQSLAFLPSSSSGEDAFTAAVLKSTSATEGVLSFQVEPRHGQDAIGDKNSSKWVAYAATALVIRFWDLAKVCTLSLSLISFIYIHLTFPYVQ